MKLLVLDGNSLVNRAYFGIKLLTTKDGRYTNAIFGFQNILLNLLSAHHPDAVAIAWDEKAPTFRHTAYDGYKATRHGMPQELAEQMPVLKQLLTDLGFVQVSKPGWEADDILGTLAAANEAAGRKAEPQKADMPFENFEKMDLRVGTVKDCVKVEKSDKLLRFVIDDGLETRTIVSGIAKFYKPEELVGKQVCFIANLPPRKMMGMASNGMLLSAEKDGKLEKRTVTVGTFDETYNTYEILDGLAAEDYIAFPEDGMEEGDPTTHTMPTEDPSAEPSDGVDDSGTIGDGVDDSGAIGDSADTGPIEGGEEESAGSEDGESSQTGGVTYAR